MHALARKCSAAVRHSLPFGGPLLRGSVPPNLPKPGYMPVDGGLCLSQLAYAVTE